MTIHPFDRSQYSILKQAVNALAAVCDGAETHDEQGFDGSDTRAGHLLAFLPLDAWPLCMFHRAWKWTRKYGQQLMKLGVDCAAVSEPPLFEGEGGQIALQPDGPGWLVVFPYDDELIAAFKCIPGGFLRSHPIGKGKQVFRYRTVQPVPGAGRALLVFARRYGFHLSPGVEELALETPDDACALAAHRLVLDPHNAAAFALYFPRNPMLNDQVKSIPGRVPIYGNSFHWLVPATAHTASYLRRFLQLNQQFEVTPDAQALLDELLAIPRMG